jgi:FixJ family two-component response regulator
LDNLKGAVAVVDDDPAVLDSLKFLLEVAGHSVADYASGPQFLQNVGGWPACLIVDQHMPDMTGLELAERLLGEGVDVPMMLITGSSTPAIVTRAAQLGIKEVVAKPATEADLLRFVEAYG